MKNHLFNFYLLPFFCYLSLVPTFGQSSVVYPDSIVTKNLRLSGQNSSNTGPLFANKAGKVVSKPTGQLFIPAAAFQPVDYTTSFHNDGEACYFDIGTSYNGIVAPLILPDSVTITLVSFFMRVYGGTDYQNFYLKQAEFNSSYWGSMTSNNPSTIDLVSLSGILGPGAGVMARIEQNLTVQVNYRTIYSKNRSYYFKISNSSGIWNGGGGPGVPTSAPNKFYGVLVKYKY